MITLPFSSAIRAIAAVFLASGMARGGEAYYTGFETFTAGNDTIVGTDAWTGSYAGAKL